MLHADEVRQVAGYIVGDKSLEEFVAEFSGKWSEGFDPQADLQRLAVVNQTTMLAEETKEVASILREAMLRKHGVENLDYHFADTNDTLCYATNWNQNATKSLIDARPDLAVIVGGYNSSNTSHLVEICSQTMPSYLIKSSDELLSVEWIRHFDIETRDLKETDRWLPAELPVRLAITSGASCPDILLNAVVEKIAGFYGYTPGDIEEALESLSLYESTQR